MIIVNFDLWQNIWKKWDKRSVFLIYANYIHVVSRQSIKMNVSATAWFM